MSEENIYANLEVAVNKVIVAMDNSSIVSAYRSNLSDCISNLQMGKDAESSLRKIDQLMMSPRLLQDLQVDGLSQDEWMNLLLNVVDEIDALRIKGGGKRGRPK